MLRITDAARRNIVADCQARRPEEACGFLISDVSGRVVRAVVADNVWPDAAERAHRFAIEPLTQLKVERDCDAAGQAVAGYYHSHPTAPAFPSEFDHSRAWPVYHYVIVGFSHGDSVEFRSWRLDEFDRFVEHAVEIVE